MIWIDQIQIDNNEHWQQQQWIDHWQQLITDNNMSREERNSTSWANTITTPAPQMLSLTSYLQAILQDTRFFTSIHKDNHVNTIILLRLDHWNIFSLSSSTRQDIDTGNDETRFEILFRYYGNNFSTISNKPNTIGLEHFQGRYSGTVYSIVLV